MSENAELMSTAPSFFKRTAVTQVYSTVTQPYCDTAVQITAVPYKYCTHSCTIIVVEAT